MKRNPELIRLILEAVEKKQSSEPESVSIPEYPDEAIDAHVEMLKDDSLVEAIISKDETGATIVTFVERLTNRGHQYLAELRESNRNNTKPDRVAKMLQSVRSHPIFAVLIFLGITIIAVGNLTDALSKIIASIWSSSHSKNEVVLDNRPAIPLNSFAIHSQVLAHERANFERYLQKVDADSFAIVFEVHDGKITNIYVCQKSVDASDAPQARLMAKPKWLRLDRSLVQGAANDSILQALSKYTYRVEPDTGDFWLPIYFLK